jgi:MFS family permease
MFMFGTVWVYISEIFPTKIRAQGTAICTFWGQVMGVILQQVGLQIYNDIGYLFYLVFIVCTAAAGFIYFFFLPETKGVTLEDISLFFGDDIVATFEESKMRVDDALRKVIGGDILMIQSADHVNKGVAEEVEKFGGI